MARSSFYWGNFLGGEWDTQAQGDISDPRYGTAMNLCLNSLPREAGSWIRRPGTQFLGTTHLGHPAKLHNFPVPDQGKGIIELTARDGAGAMRLWLPPFFLASGVLLGDEPYTLYCDVMDNATINTATPAVITTANAHAPWATGQTVILFLPPDADNVAHTVANRQFLITKLTNTTFSLQDPLTGANIAGTIPELAGGIAYVGHIQVWGTSYTDIVTTKATRVVPADEMTFVLSHPYEPFVLKRVDATPLVPYTFASGFFEQLDGPYIDPLVGASQTSNSTGSVALNVDTVNWDFTITDAAYSFVSTDVNRPIRLWSQPPAWSAGTTYLLGANVTYLGTFWKLGRAGTPAGVAPGQSYTSGGVNYTPWGLNPEAGAWNWGSIISVTSTSVVKCAMHAPPNVNGALIDTWQLGVYTNFKWPSCGTWHEGRLWLGGALPNRIDASIAGLSASNFPEPTDTIHSPPFSPTDPHGQVLDNNAISEHLASAASNSIRWMAPDSHGVLIGTEGGEWLIEASNLADPLTPTTIQARPMTVLGCADMEALRIGPAMIFAQTHKRRVFEYLADAFTQRFTGRPLNAKYSVFGDPVDEFAYQEQSEPVLWAKVITGKLFGCTYRRISRFATEQPAAWGWHQHIHGRGWLFESITSASRQEGEHGAIVGVTTASIDDLTSPRYVEVLTQIFEPIVDARCGWYLDQATWPRTGAQAAEPSVIISAGPFGTTVESGGKFYFELDMDPVANSIIFGVATSDFNVTGRAYSWPRALPATLGDGTKCAYYELGGTGTCGVVTSTWDNNSQIPVGGHLKFGCVVDTVNKIIYARDITHSENWNGNVDGNVGGMSFATITGPVHIMFGMKIDGAAGPATVTLDTNNSPAWAGTMPSSCVAWGPATFAYTQTASLTVPNGIHIAIAPTSVAISYTDISWTTTIAGMAITNTHVNNVLTNNYSSVHNYAVGEITAWTGAFRISDVAQINVPPNSGLNTWADPIPIVLSVAGKSLS